MSNYVEGGGRVRRRMRNMSNYLGKMSSIGIVYRTSQKSFKDMGIRVIIDDFGMGYASLDYIKRSQ